MGEAGAGGEGRVDMLVEEGEEGKEKEMVTRENGVIRWESILHRMVVRVMLVEADDCTRQIISALLRKCGYRVASIPDGLKAWEALKGRPHNIDLILTEVELPSVPGFDLLTMIKEHEICKNIPVIMMSSDDSMGMIFNCMLKGAADFLVKPVRKNELMNLWQHIWRRQSSNGYSQDTQDGSFARQRIEVTSENKAASNHSNSYVANGPKNKECSEKESDTHSTCTKPNMEAESASVHNMQDMLLPITTLVSDTKLQKHEESINFDVKMHVHEIEEDKSLKFELKRTTCNRDISSVELVVEHDSANKMTQGKQVAEDNFREDANICGETEDNNSERVEVSAEAIDLIGIFDNVPHVYKAVVQKDFCNIAKTHLDSNDVSSKLNSNLLLELSLRRSHPSDHGNQHADKRNALNHSNVSAFSWYNNRSAQPVSPHVDPIECVDTSQHISNQDPVNPNDASQWNSTMLKKDQEKVCPVISVPGQAQAAKLCLHPGVIPLSLPIRSIILDSSQTGYGAVLPPMFYTQTGLPQSWTFDANSSRHCNPEVHNSDQCRPLLDQNASNSTEHSLQRHPSLGSGDHLVRASPGTGKSGTSSLHDGAASHVNSSGRGSVCNGRSENVAPTIAAKTVLENGKSEGRLIHEGIRGMNPWRSTKRKDRCYEKKVRYESRQKLAEQRPRVKGQFIRQVPVNPPLQ